MLGLEEIKNDLEIINMIDWDMTPEEAVTLYLEWGNNWSHDKKFVKSKSDVSYYFVVNTWEEEPVVYLIRRNSDEAIELASFRMPEGIKKTFLESVSYNPGVYPLNSDAREWLESELSIN